VVESLVCFQTRKTVFSDRPPSPKGQGLLPRLSSPLLSSFELSPAPPPGGEALPARVSYLFAVVSSIHLPRSSQLRYVPPSDFLNLSTAFSAANLVDLFHPTTTSRLFCSGDCSLHTARSPHRGKLPPCCSSLFPSLPGRPPVSDMSTSRLSSTWRSVVLAEANTRAPLQFSSSPRYSLRLP
jgi:hypothetical protein